FITVKNQAGDEVEGETTSTTYDISTLITGQYGNFDVAVRAYGDGEKYGTSDRSETIVYHKGDSLDKPNVEVNSATMTASWDSVQNAVEYSVSVYNGKEEVLINKEITTQTTFSFADRKDSEGKDLFEGYDKYRIAVTAKPAKDSEKYSDSLPGSDYYIKDTTLSAPTFNSLSSTRISWNKIDNAKSYILKMTYKGSDGTIKEETKETTYDYYLRSNFTYAEVGEYTFSIMAKGDGEVFHDSAWGDKTTDGKECKVTKLQNVDEQDMSLVYDKDGKATLTWSMDADPSINQFTLSLKATLPNGDRQLDSISINVSSKVVNVKGKVYDVYQYVDNTKNAVEKISGTMVVY
ncbi:MAG: hypothetical protein K2K24_02305, partial [Clostridia bacterium]|nr:hypothetical protein [Clostridia bacterium]